MRKCFKIGLLLSACLTLFGCQTMSKPPLKTVDYVDIQSFMGDWYVIANIPTFIEKGAHNAVESYSLNDDGTIATTFTFRKGSFDGELKSYHPKGFVKNSETNAVWGMQFLWPIKADYRIVYLTEDYSQVIIGRNKRDYVWIMSRTPQISNEDYQYLLGLIADMGYDTSQVQRVPQHWSQDEK